MNIPTDPTTGPDRSPSKRHGVGRTAFVAASGAFVALGMIAGLGVVGAGAQAEPEVGSTPQAEAERDVLDGIDVEEFELEDGDVIAFEGIDGDWTAYDECIDRELGDRFGDDAELTEDQWAELEAAYDAADTVCQDELPAEVLAEMEAWAPFDECMEAAFDSIDGDTFEGDAVEVTFDDDAFEAIEAECLELLPADLRADIEAEQAAWAPFDECIDGIAEPFGEAMIWLDTSEGGVAVAFGEEAGSVTITGSTDGITIAESAGVTVLDEAALDAEFEALDDEYAACEDLLPEGTEIEMFDDIDGEILDEELLLD